MCSTWLHFGIQELKELQEANQRRRRRNIDRCYEAVQDNKQDHEALHPDHCRQLDKLRTYKRTQFQEATLGNWEGKNKNWKGSRMDKTRASTSSLSSGRPEATQQLYRRRRWGSGEWGKGKFNIMLNVWFLENLKPKPHWLQKHCGRVDSTEDTWDDHLQCPCIWRTTAWFKGTNSTQKMTFRTETNPFKPDCDIACSYLVTDQRNLAWNCWGTGFLY